MVDLINSEKRRYIILILALLLILKVFSCSIVPETKKEYTPRCKSVSEEQEISSAEIDAFLKLWVEYIQKGYNKEVSDQISLLSGKIEDKMPLKIKLWFNKNCWTISRFYYVEERLKSIIQAIYLKRHTASILNILNSYITEENKDQYQHMIDMQHEIANIENVSEGELAIVEMREAEIVNILNLK